VWYRQLRVSEMPRHPTSVSRRARLALSLGVLAVAVTVNAQVPTWQQSWQLNRWVARVTVVDCAA
jgi:hypothetical protein